MTVPIEWDSPSDGTQSTVLAGVGQTPLTYEPSRSFCSRMAFDALIFRRSSCETIPSAVSGSVSFFTSYV